MAVIELDHVRAETQTARSVEIYTGMPPASITDAWRALAVAAENPFATPEWLEAWCEAQPADRPLILACRDACEELVGVLPLVVTATGSLCAPGADYADWFAPACASEDEAAIAAASLAALRESGHLGRPGDLLGRALVMQRCPLDGGWRAGAHAAGVPGVKVIEINKVVELSSIRFSSPMPISGKDRRELRRSLRRLEDAHDVILRRSRTSQDAARDFADFRALHTGRWTHLCDPVVARFHEGFALRAAEQGWLRLWTMEVDGAPAAMLYGWRLGDRQFAYLQAFDARWSRHGVGIVLLAHAIEQAEKEGVSVFDMLRGKGHHKARFENDRRMVRTHVAVPNPSMSYAKVRGVEAARRFYRRLPDEGVVGELKHRIRG